MATATPAVQEVVRGVLERHDPAAAAAWNSTFQPQEGAVTLHAQLCGVNKFFRLRLGELPQNTVEERMCLTDDQSLDDWVRNFETFVVPTVISHDLLRVG